MDTLYGPVGARLRLARTPAPAPAWATPGRRWAIVTAWNPDARAVSAGRNHAAQAAFEARLRAGRWTLTPALNGHGAWQEPSVLIWDAPLAQARHWGEALRQAAVLWGVGDRAALVWTAPGTQDTPPEWFWAVAEAHPDS